MLSAYLRKSRLVLVALPAVLAVAASFWAFNASASDSALTIKVEINGRMLYFPMAWAGWLSMRSVPEYDWKKPKTDVVYQTTAIVQNNKATRAFNEQRPYRNGDLWPDFKVEQFRVQRNSAPPSGKTLDEQYPQGWWPLPRSMNFVQGGIGFIECSAGGPEQMRAQFGLYWMHSCAVSRRASDGLGINYDWNRVEVEEANERAQDLRMQRLIEWLLTPPDRRPSRLAD